MLRLWDTIFMRSPLNYFERHVLSVLTVKRNVTDRHYMVSEALYVSGQSSRTFGTALLSFPRDPTVCIPRNLRSQVSAYMGIDNSKWPPLHISTRCTLTGKHQTCIRNYRLHFMMSTNQCIQFDASKDGLGAVLLQAERPVAYSSRSLTDTEKRYTQIEKEMLSIVHVATKFHCFIFGKETVVYNDH